MTALVTKHLPLVAGAPDGIKKLRELILDLAVSGKLVPQAQEPTAIEKHSPQNDASEAAALRSSADADYTPFPTPSEWGWKKLGDIAVIERGGSPRPIKSFLTTASDGLNWIKIGDTEKGGKYITSASEKIRPEGLAKTRMVYPGDFLLTNSMSFGRPYITQIEGCIHDGWLRISPPDSLDRDYLYALLSSQYVRRFFVNAAAGAVVMNLNADKVRELPVPLPPLAEQHRIVAKVDELMALCDRLEADQADAEAAHAQLVQALLDSLTQATDAADFRASWQRLSEHFHTLFTTEASIEALKQTVLQLAVMGRLVQQVDADESALKLLDRIAQDLATTNQSSRSKKSRVIADVESSERYTELPGSWAWTRLGALVRESGAGWSPSCEARQRIGDEWGVLKVSAVSWGEYRAAENKALPANLEARPEHEVKVGDFLVSRANTAELVARRVVVGARPPRLMLSDKIVRLNLTALCNLRFINLVNSAPASRNYYSAIAGGTSSSMKNVSREQILNLPLALPPLEEQNRIVAKVDELMALCDQLKTQLAEARQQHSQLASVLVEQAVA